uniref:C2 domain-containing protein n=1 Tax=Caenorhabditis tropicalis TaxID=1561998 RepID=A0A1I7UKH4_9PELO
MGATKLFSALEQLVGGGGGGYPSSPGGREDAATSSSAIQHHPLQYATCQPADEDVYPPLEDDEEEFSDGMSMRLLCITNEFNSYVTVKLQNVKSTTVAVRGNLPCWEQEFIFETNRPDDGMVLELWAKGVLWDKLIGVHYMPLSDVKYSNVAGSGQWLQMDHELETRNGQTVGTRGPTGHNLLADVRFELPFG